MDFRGCVAGDEWTVENASRSDTSRSRAQLPKNTPYSEGNSILHAWRYASHLNHLFNSSFIADDQLSPFVTANRPFLFTRLQINNW